MMDEQGAIIGGTILFTIVIIVVSIAATVIPIVLIFRWLGKMRGANQQLLMNGIPAQARVVQMGATGLTVNESPQLNVVLEVHPPQGPGYRAPAVPLMATIQAFVPVYAMGRVQPGTFVPVRFDPMNPQNVAIDFRGMGFM
jgi:hypothetical protein